MIPIQSFYDALCRFRPPPSDDQRDAIEKRKGEPLFIVAGPGTGKTTCLTLRVLKLVLVDQVPPQGIIATTFTRKAAAELRSRILGWGFRLVEELGKDEALSREKLRWVSKVDVNQIRTGTIDSLCEQILVEYREPGTMPPVLIDEFVSRTLMLREGLFHGRRHLNQELDRFLRDRFSAERLYRWGVGVKNDLLQAIWERRHEDLIDWKSFLSDCPRDEKQARDALNEALSAYEAYLAEAGLMDFPLLENSLLGRLQNRQLGDFVSPVREILVDEYQDTNLLQESIYFEMTKASGGALTVVGDDDQSLYRFRGATVELFSDYEQRFEKVFHRKPRKVFLKENYRSTSTIIKFVNRYATLDRSYQAVRVKEKPCLSEKRTSKKEVPILGLFRNDVAELARSLSHFIRQVFCEDGYRMRNGRVIRADPEKGAVGDCALLCSSPAEYGSSGQQRLPFLLRQELESHSPRIRVFNPRGQELREIPVIQRFGGLLLYCLDPSREIEDQTSGLNDDIRNMFTQWRSQAESYLRNRSQAELRTYCEGWADRNPKSDALEWPYSVPVLDLIYGLVHYFPDLYDESEGQVYLEVFTRQVSACEQVGKFKGRVVTRPDNEELSARSVMELLRDFLGPIASGTIKVNEELIEAFPRDQLSILSIHQAKGLEFPLTIVDVGSDFRTDHWTQAFKRFPRRGGWPHAMEDLFRRYTDLGKPDRQSTDRAFDDLYRLFFVAYSRPQQVLMLVGLQSTLPTEDGGIQNVALGYSRDGRCTWERTLPFMEI